MNTRSPFLFRPPLLRGLLSLVCVLIVGTADAQIRGISYTGSPVGEYVFFSNNAGLKPAFLYGGEVGFGFGQYIELGGLYLFNDKLETDFSNIEGVGSLTQELLTGISGRKVGMRRYGGNLKVNFSEGQAVPFLRLGAGVLRFEPDGLERTSTVYLLGGAGLQLNQSGRYTLTASVENLLYRYSLAGTLFSEEDAATIGFVTESFNRTQVNNWALRLGLKVYLGGGDDLLGSQVDAAFKDQFSGGLSGLRLRVEPYAGAIRFGDDTGFQSSHAVLGASAGIDIGPFVGLRGFVWRASNADAPFRTDDLTAYGAEGKFGFSSGWRSTSPFIILGAGYLDSGKGYEGPDGHPDDQPFVQGGVGLTLPLSSRVRLQASARALLMSTQEVADVTSTSQVTRSMMYTGGISFGVGGGGGREDAPIVARESATRSADATRLLQALDALDQGDSLAFYRSMAGLRQQSAVVVQEPAETRSNLSAETITIPIPEEGEIILRFGKGSASTAVASGESVAAAPAVGADLQAQPGTSEFEARVQAEVQRQLALRGISGTEPQQNDATAQQLAQMEERLQQRMLQEMLLLRRQINTTGDQDLTIVDAPYVAPASSETVLGNQLHALSVLTGGRFGEGPYRFLLGARADLRSRSRVRLLPEMTLGFGSGSPSFALLANAALPLGVTTPYRSAPYVGIGAGLASERFLSGLGLVFNLFTGVDVPIGNNVVFGEISTLDFFSYNRFVVGYRIIL